MIRMTLFIIQIKESKMLMLFSWIYCVFVANHAEIFVFLSPTFYLLIAEIHLF